MADLTTSIQVKAGKETVELQSLMQFRESHGNIKNQAVHYAMQNDLIDYILVGSGKAGTRMIVLTEKTKTYKPNNSAKRQTDEVPATETE